MATSACDRVTADAQSPPNRARSHGAHHRRGHGHLRRRAHRRSRAHLRRRAHRRSRAILGATIGAFAAVAALAAGPLVFPGNPRPGRAGAVLVLAGAAEHSRLAAAEVAVARSGAATMLFSRGGSATAVCPAVAHVQVVCFQPRPARTVGEIVFAEQWAARHHLGHLVVVAGLTQTFRARLLTARCYPGRATVLPSPLPWQQLAYQVVYEWGALVKALTWARGC